MIEIRGGNTMTRLAAVLLLSLLPFSAFPHDNDDRTDDLLRAIKKARVIDLSHTWTQQSPIAGVNPGYSFSLRDTHENTRPNFDGHLSFASDVMSWSGQHGAPSIDAIGHIGRDGKLFGGVDANASTSDPDGIGASGVGAHLAIDRFPKDLLINRGVMLDVASMVNGDLSPLPAQFEITARHLQDAAKRQRTQVKKGDTVFIRTGWGQHFAANSALYQGDFSPGPGLDAANWLIKQGARIVGNDTLTFEQRPPIVQAPQFQIFPVHMRLIADSGIYIIENLDLEGLAKARAYEFAVVVPPIKVSGGTGSAVRVFALVAD
jgi:kynurenine formamidase